VEWSLGGRNAGRRCHGTDGFNKNSLPAGTEIVVEGYQAKDGANRAVGANLTYAADGKRLFLGGSAPGANGGGENP
jgi:hypothetical protein